MDMNSSDMSLPVMYPCVKCQVCYQDYKLLLEHLYWRHGTESQFCTNCSLKRWVYADHMCHVLPIDDDASVSFEDSQCNSERESEYCYCGKEFQSVMIGCDGPQCPFQWYHYACVGISEAPPGDWFCQQCRTGEGEGPNENERMQT